MNQTIPPIARSARGLRTSVFARLADKIKAMGSEFLPLHIGDTYRTPPEEALLPNQDWTRAGLYKYAHPHGQPEFLEALSHKLNSRNGIPAGTDALQVANGATQALSAAAGTVLDAGDEVLVLSPFWPLIVGVLKTMRAEPVQVPWTMDLEPYVTERTRAIYFGNPNNPDGRVLSRAELERLSEVARRHNLWVLADEVYEDYAYDGREHVSLASLPGMFERTLTVFSFSKSYALAGNRVGVVVAHPEAMNPLRRVANHQVYNVSQAMQTSALNALLHGDAWLAESRELYDRARRTLHAGLEGRCELAQGGAYLWLTLDSEQAAWNLIERALERGLGLAPGEAFGDRFGHCIRICFTAAPLEGVERAAALLRELLQ
ncbi:MAG: pyridoxal phosphate-dependent aminotransferase [Candidatus Eremiobacterota bacterium]